MCEYGAGPSRTTENALVDAIRRSDSIAPFVQATGCKWISRKVWEHNAVRMVQQFKLAVRDTDVIEMVHKPTVEDDAIEWLLRHAVQQNREEVVYHIVLTERVELLRRVLVLFEIGHDWMVRLVSCAIVLELEDALECFEQHGLVEQFDTKTLLMEAIRHRLPNFLDLYGFCEIGFDQVCPDWEAVLANRRVVLERSWEHPDLVEDTIKMYRF